MLLVCVIPLLTAIGDTLIGFVQSEDSGNGGEPVADIGAGIADLWKLTSIVPLRARVKSAEEAERTGPEACSRVTISLWRSHLKFMDRNTSAWQPSERAAWQSILRSGLRKKMAGSIS